MELVSARVSTNRTATRFPDLHGSAVREVLPVKRFSAGRMFTVLFGVNHVTAQEIVLLYQHSW